MHTKVHQIINREAENLSNDDLAVLRGGERRIEEEEKKSRISLLRLNCASLLRKSLVSTSLSLSLEQATSVSEFSSCAPENVEEGEE